MAKDITCSNLNDNNSYDSQSSISTNPIVNDGGHFLSKLDVKSYGTITFPRNYCNRASFIRIPPNVCPTQVKELLIEQNHSKRSSLFISVLGSAKESYIKSKLFRIFRKGLLKVAKTTEIWIITAGMNSRITKFFGEIVRTNPDPSRPIYLIGISPWGCISGVDQLDVHGTNVIYSKSKNDAKGEIPPEPNHTHFIFIDDGTKHKHQAAIQFRAKFERITSGECLALKNMMTNNNNEKINVAIRSYLQSKRADKIPVVIVVTEGCSDAIKKVHESVVNDRIPVVFVEGTGGCCDLFAKCYHLYNGYKSKAKLDNQTNEDSSSLIENDVEIKNKIRKTLKIVNHELDQTSCTDSSEKGTDYFELIYECVSTRNILLNFIDFKVHNLTGDDVNLAILQAVFKVTSENDSSKINLEEKRQQLNLAYEWKQIDIIKNSIMKNERDWKLIELNDLFEKALIENEAKFIELFLDHDFSLDDLFENNNKLLDLYKNENYYFKDGLNNPLRSIYTEIIQPLIGNFFQVDAISYSDCLINNSFTELSNNQRNYHSKNTINETDYNKELFLWSVLTGRQELALLFWTRGRNKMCAAFIAILIYKSKARNENTIKYNQWIDQFDHLAVRILEKFYSTNPSKCKLAIIRAIQEFDNVTSLQLAVMAESKLFISKQGVQDVLNDIWNGCIDHHQVGNSLIIFSSFMLWYSGFLPYHEELVEGSNTNNESNNFQDASNIFECYMSRSKSSIDKICKDSDAASLKLMDDGFDKEANSVTVVKNNRWKRSKNSVNQYLKNVSMFLRAPYVKYLYNLYFHLIFLMLFSYVILCDYFPLYKFQSDQCFSSKEKDSYSRLLIHKAGKRSSNLTEINWNINNNSSFKYNPEMSTTELILILWVFTLFCEEIREITAKNVEPMYRKIGVHFSLFWNQLDALAICLFFIGCIFRFLPINQCFCGARIILAVDLSLWYIRTLDLFSAIRRLGPKLVMIGEMVHDLKFFMLILAVFILAFGVPTYSLLHDVQTFSWHMPRDIINLAYWQIFGELLAIDDIEKNYEINGYVMFFLLVAYIAIASVLLINLLIAMFSNTFDRLHSDTNCIWKFQQYSLVCYHLTRPLLPPPFIIISHIWRITLHVFTHIFKIKWFYDKYIEHKNEEKFNISVNQMLTKQIEEIEDALGHEVYFLFLSTARKQIDYENDSNEKRIYSPQENVLSRIKTLENQQSNMLQYLEFLMNGIKKIGGDDIEMPKRHRIDSERSSSRTNYFFYQNPNKKVRRTNILDYHGF